MINLSLSTKKRDFYSMFHELTDEAYFKNVMLVSAINNVPAPSYPSEYSSVFSVAAHEGKDPMRWDYNPSPRRVRHAGIDVEVPWQKGSTIRSTGNSFAAPCIAGIVTRILEQASGAHAVPDEDDPARPRRQLGAGGLIRRRERRRPH